MVADCPTRGWVRTLDGQVACITGKVWLDGAWVERKHCITLLEEAGGAYKPDYSRRVSLVVFGDLASAVVTDPERRYSQKLDGAQADRERGHHVHVVDARGFAELLDGGAAVCRALRGKSQQVLPAHERGDGVLGGPLRPVQVGVHDDPGLALDLSALDAATVAHEETVQSLVGHLADQGTTARGPARDAPRFDLGWATSDKTYIAEVKSLTGTSEDQQIRLGIGQVLDYAHQLRSTGELPLPVLVLQREPVSRRWLALAEATGIILTWGPDFPRI